MAIIRHGGAADETGFTDDGTDVRLTTATDAVGIGTINPPNTLSVSPIRYSTGTASQSGTTVTGVGTTWIAGMIGDEFVYADGTSSGEITARASNTSITVVTSQTVASQAYTIHYQGLHVKSDGTVGIGNKTPEYALDLHGHVNESYQFTPRYIRFGAENDVADISGGMIWKSAYDGYTKIAAQILGVCEGNFGRQGLVFYTGNDSDDSTNATEKMRLNMDGNLGVGTAAPTHKLTVKNTANDTAGSGSLAFIPGGATDDYHSIRLSATGQDLCFDRFYSSANAESLRISRATGNVGIGSSAPAAKLEIKPAALSAFTTIATAMPGGIALNMGADVATNELAPALSWYSDDGSLDADGSEDHIGAITMIAAEDFDNSNDSGAAMVFYTHKIATGAGLTEKMRILDSGKVGIGTGTPGVALTVNGGSGFEGAQFGGTRDTGSPGFVSLIGENDADEVVEYARLWTNITGNGDGAEEGDLVIQTMKAGTLTTNLFLDGSTKYVGVVEATPSKMLDVYNGASGGDILAYDVYTHDGGVTSSDERMKENITSSALGLDFINSLNPVSYKWKDTEEVVEKVAIEASDAVYKTVLDSAATEARDAVYETVLVSPAIEADEENGIEAKEAAYEERLVSEAVEAKATTYKEVLKTPAFEASENVQTYPAVSYARTHYGLIAQEVKQTLHDAGLDNSDFAGYCYEEDRDKHALRYNEFISPLIKAVQELTARVEELENK